MTDKNYSDELTAQIVEAYTASADSDEARATVLKKLSKETGKPVRSLIAKLVKEQVYIKKTYVTKNGKKAETKDEIVTAIAKVLGVVEEQLAGLNKATKPTLNLLRSQFIAAREVIAGLSSENQENNS